MQAKFHVDTSFWEQCKSYIDGSRMNQNSYVEYVHQFHRVSLRKDQIKLKMNLQ